MAISTRSISIKVCLKILTLLINHCFFSNITNTETILIVMLNIRTRSLPGINNVYSELCVDYYTANVIVFILYYDFINKDNHKLMEFKWV